MKYLLNIYIWIAGIVLTFLFYLLCLNHVSYNEIGIAYNSLNGEISKQSVGWHFTPPWVRATTILIIPVRIELFGHNNKFVLPKIVKFKEEYYKEFIKINGFSYIDSTERVLNQYVFSGKKWIFLEEFKTEE